MLRDFSDKQILVVDDDNISTMLLCEMLAPINPYILTASDGIEALDLVKKYPAVDLILLDIRMPNMDGYKAIEQIKKINNVATIIAQTALATDQNNIKEAGFDAFISKPIESGKLIEVISYHLNK